MAKQGARRRGSQEAAGATGGATPKASAQTARGGARPTAITVLAAAALAVLALIWTLFRGGGPVDSAPSEDKLQQFLTILSDSRNDGPTVAVAMVRAGAIAVKDAVVTLAEGEVPLVLGVVQLYLMQYFPEASPTQKVARRAEMLALLAAMFERGADPDATAPGFFGGFPALWVAVRKGDVALCKCLVKAGARTVHRAKRGLLHELADGIASGAFDPSGLAKPLLHLQSALAASPQATTEDVLYGIHSKFVMSYEQSDSAKKIVSGMRSRSHPDLLRSELHTIDADLFIALFDTLRTAPDFDIRLLGAKTPAGANVFHLAAEGPARCVATLADAAVAAGAEAAALALGALRAADSLGRTPLHLAAIYGGGGPDGLSPTLSALLEAARALAAAAGLRWRSPEDFMEDLGLDQLGSGVVEYSVWQRPVPKELLPAPGGISRSGGWSAVAYGKARPGSRCDIPVLEAPVDKSLLIEHVLASRPLLLRGEAAHYKFRKRFRRETFLRRHGHRRIRVSTVPYGAQFGLAPDAEMTVAEFVSGFGDSASDSAPQYAFTNTLVDEHPDIRKDFDPLPDVAEGASINGAGFRVTAHQFFLGPPDSGASMHFHNDALNTLAYGRKRWMMLPPSRAVYSKRHPMALLDDERYGAGGDLEPWECMQEAGDIIYVPHNWAHATINVEESIGVAYEFGISGKTMHSFHVV